MFFYFHAGSSSVTLPHVNKKMPLPRELGTPALRDSRLNLARRLCSNPGIINCWQNHLSQCKWCFLTIQLNFYTPPPDLWYLNVWMCLNIKYIPFLFYFGGDPHFLKKGIPTQVIPIQQKDGVFWAGPGQVPTGLLQCLHLSLRTLFILTHSFYLNFLGPGLTRTHTFFYCPPFFTQIKHVYQHHLNCTWQSECWTEFKNSQKFKMKEAGE